MRPTLFFIPHDLPGLGLTFQMAALIALAVLGAAWIAWTLSRKGGAAELPGLVVTLGVLGLAAYYVIPEMEAEMPGGGKGLPVQGYGVMLLLAMMAGVSLAAWRASRRGLDPSVIYSLAFVVFVAGIAGARLFFVIQYWNTEFAPPGEPGRDWATLFGRVFAFHKGGLVVYGSFVGAVLAAVIFFAVRRLPMLAMADLAAPSLLVGLALGRVGCLLNGCCYGGMCDVPALSLTFPPAGVPYNVQLQDGRLFGLTLGRPENEAANADDPQAGRPDADRVATERPGAEPPVWDKPRPILAVEPDSAAEAKGLAVGDVVTGFRTAHPIAVQSAMLPEGDRSDIVALVQTRDGRVTRFTAEDLPPRSRPLYATQVFSILKAILLAVTLLAIDRIRWKDGQVFVVGLAFYAIARFLIEDLRDDVGGYFGTEFTISQWVSMAALVAAGGLTVVVALAPPGLRLPKLDAGSAGRGSQPDGSGQDGSDKDDSNMDGPDASASKNNDRGANSPLTAGSGSVPATTA